ncbi:MAG: PaaI family thioesterase [Acidobacteriota bacterium]
MSGTTKSGRPEPSLQERFAPTSTCFGCGPANPQGLQIQSFLKAGTTETLLCTWRPADHHAAYATFVNGGVIGAIFDCHSNWAATWHLMQRDALDNPPCTVTGDFQVRFKRPTPMTEPLLLEATAVASKGSKVEVEATLAVGQKVTATCNGTFIAVKPGHPAYHRW